MEKILLDQRDIARLRDENAGAAPQQIMRAALQAIPEVTLACSFGAEDMVLLDMLMEIEPAAHVFYLDTDVLFAETYALKSHAVERYGIPNLIRVRPELSLETQAREYGDKLWESNPNECCNIRKVKPLEKVLSGYNGWITGIRRDQAPTRAHAQIFEHDAKFGMVKVNPLAFWTTDQVWDYIRQHDVPYNPLHDQGYPSIGCLHCTRAVSDGEDPRSGRWAGSEKTECGLHQG